MGTTGRRAKNAGGTVAQLVRKPSRAKRLLPWKLRIVLGVGGLALGAGGAVLALVGFLVRRRLKG